MIQTMGLTLVTGKKITVVVKNIHYACEQDGTDARSVVMKGGGVFYVRESIEEITAAVEKLNNSSQ